MARATYDNDVKRKSILKQKNAISKFLLRSKKASDLRVAFFPGAEALEYEVAYGPLGINPQNIFGIERERDRHSYWIDQGMFQMGGEPATALEFFSGYKGDPFDVINLDYDGSFNEDVLSTLKEIVLKQALAPRGVFITNFYGKREQKRTKELYGMAELINAQGEMISKIRNLDNLDDITGVERSGDTYRMTFHFDTDIQSLRHSGPGNLIKYLFRVGKGLRGNNPTLYNKHPRSVEWDKIVDSMVAHNEGDLWLNIGPYRRVEISGLEDGQKRILLWGNLFLNKFLSSLNNYLVNRGHSFDLLGILNFISSGSFLTRSHESYSYTSDSGANMLFDIFCFDQRRDITSRYMELYQTLFTKDFPKGPHYRPSFETAKIGRGGKAFLTKMKRAKKQLEKDLMILGLNNSLNPNPSANPLPNRVYLGSALKPTIRSKKRLKELVADGKTKEEIESQFNLSEELTRSLGAYIAHRTMGRYNIQQKVENEEVEERKDLEKIIEQPRISRLIPRKKMKKLKKDGRISSNGELRIRFFEDDVEHLTLERKSRYYNNITQSKWYDLLLKRDISDYHIYAFFDDLTLSVIDRYSRIPSVEEVRGMWTKVTTAKELCPFNNSNGKKIIQESPKKGISERIKREVREMINAGIDKEEIWEAYKNYFSSRKQFGSVIAWASPKLAKKRKN